MSRIRLTPDLQQTIAAYIRAGGYPHVAAEAAGVPRRLFNCWLRLSASARYRGFRQAVMQARRQCRLGAEIAIRNDRPLDWLKSGPGKEAPGWTGPARAPVLSRSQQSNPLLTAQLQRLAAEMLRALTAFPDARAHLAGVIEPLPANDAK